MSPALRSCWILAMLVAPAVVRAQSPAERAAVERAVLDYVEGFYEGEMARYEGTWMIRQVLWQSPPRR